jgi:pimeloyl-ACP methyl ester carboxylesterase
LILGSRVLTFSGTCWPAIVIPTRARQGAPGGSPLPPLLFPSRAPWFSSALGSGRGRDVTRSPRPDAWHGRRAPSSAVCACALALVALSGCAVRRAGRPFEPPPATAVAAWHGYERFDFSVDGRFCIVVRPKKVAPGTPWVWRATFFEERPEVELALLARGFHVAYMDVTDLCGSPTAVALWDAFYRYLTEEQGFAARPALTAISRGGLIAHNWAAAHPERVACIYADIPVCDFKSWPGGKGGGPGDAAEWRRCLEVYGFDEAQAQAYMGNPVDNLAPLAKAGVPLLHAVGAADRLVPFDENTGLLVSRYRVLGGAVDVIVKPGVGHTPGLDDPTPVIEFTASHAQMDDG